MVEAMQIAFAEALKQNQRQADLHYNVTIYFCSEEEIQAANKNYRSVDKVTDVLSFPMFNLLEGEWQQNLAPPDYLDPTQLSLGILLGELLLCPQVILKQAAEYQQSPERESAFLAVHGLLHLLGYDHDDITAENKMRQLQSSAMRVFAPDIAARPSPNGNSEFDSIVKAGKVALVGEPNVGKSTLFNYIAGLELAITSAKAQTTRNLIRAVVNQESCQIVFIDSPGMHESKHQLDRYMATAIRSALEEADIVLLLIDARSKCRVEERSKRLAQQLKASGKSLIVVLNKCELLPKEKLLPLLSCYYDALQPAAIIPLSALSGDGVSALLAEIRAVLPLGEALVPADYYTDQSELALAQELIRVELLRQLDDELPHEAAVMIESFEEDYLDSVRQQVRIAAIIVIDKAKHKSIILGKKGQKIKAIGIASRERLSAMLDCPTHLQLFVQVKEGWRQKSTILKTLGYGNSDA